VILKDPGWNDGGGLFQLRDVEEDPPLQAAPRERTASGRMQPEGHDDSGSFARIACFSAFCAERLPRIVIIKRRTSRGRDFDHLAGLDHCHRSTRRPGSRSSGTPFKNRLCKITKCCTEVGFPENKTSTITDNRPLSRPQGARGDEPWTKRYFDGSLGHWARCREGEERRRPGGRF